MAASTAVPGCRTNPYREGMEPPVIFWVPAIATSGLTFYTGDRFPNWKNNLFIGGMREGEVPRSGHLERVDFNSDWQELHREGILRDLEQRIRDIREGPDGLLYILTAENAGALDPYRAGEVAAPKHCARTLGQRHIRMRHGETGAHLRHAAASGG